MFIQHNRWLMACRCCSARDKWCAQSSEELLGTYQNPLQLRHGGGEAMKNFGLQAHRQCLL